MSADETTLAMNTPVGADVRRLVATAMQAPSPHNTQPWRFAVSQDGDTVLLRADRARALPVNDPADRELMISCGAALFTLVLAARRGGRSTSVSTLPDADDPDLVAEIVLAPESDIDRLRDDEMHVAVEHRHTRRDEFTSLGIDPRLLELAENIAGEHDVHLDLIAADDRVAIATLVAEGDRRQFANRAWRRELASWMRPRSAGAGLTVPRLAAPFVRAFLSNVDVGRRVADADHALVVAAPAVAVLSTDRDEPADWLRTGEALQHVLLRLAAHGVQAGFMNQPCQVPALRQELSALSSRGTYSQLVVRLGHPASIRPPSPRRPTDDVIDQR